MIKPFDGFAIRKSGQLIVEDFRGYETRNESTIALIRQAIEKHDVADFDWILVNTGDETINGKKPNHPLFSYCTDTDNFDFCCPDFIFDHWRQTGLDDYEETRLRISAMDEPPLTDTIGWRGANTHPSRVNLVENFKSRCSTSSGSTGIVKIRTSSRPPIFCRSKIRSGNSDI